MLCAKTALLLVVVLVLIASAASDTDYDRPFTFNCPAGMSLAIIRSKYSEPHKDRGWSFSCRPNTATLGRCHFSNYVNGFDDLLNFHCPYSGFITGISSYHDNFYEDRRFRFKCCRSSHFIRYHCITTHFINNWRAQISFQVPFGYYLSGATSVHDNGQEDRRWKFEYCKIKKL